MSCSNFSEGVQEKYLLFKKNEFALAVQITSYSAGPLRDTIVCFTEKMTLIGPHSVYTLTITKYYYGYLLPAPILMAPFESTLFGPASPRICSSVDSKAHFRTSGCLKRLRIQTLLSEIFLIMYRGGQRVTTVSATFSKARWRYCHGLGLHFIK